MRMSTEVKLFPSAEVVLLFITALAASNPICPSATLVVPSTETGYYTRRAVASSSRSLPATSSTLINIGLSHESNLPERSSLIPSRSRAASAHDIKNTGTQQQLRQRARRFCSERATEVDCLKATFPWGCRDCACVWRAPAIQQKEQTRDAYACEPNLNSICDSCINRTKVKLNRGCYRFPSARCDSGKLLNAVSSVPCK